MEPRRSSRAKKAVQVFDPALVIPPVKTKKKEPDRSVEEIYKQIDAQEQFRKI